MTTKIVGLNKYCDDFVDRYPGRCYVSSDDSYNYLQRLIGDLHKAVFASGLNSSHRQLFYSAMASLDIDAMADGLKQALNEVAEESRTK